MSLLRCTAHAPVVARTHARRREHQHMQTCTRKDALRVRWVAWSCWFHRSTRYRHYRCPENQESKPDTCGARHTAGWIPCTSSHAPTITEHRAVSFADGNVWARGGWACASRRDGDVGCMCRRGRITSTCACVIATRGYKPRAAHGRASGARADRRGSDIGASGFIQRRWAYTPTCMTRIRHAAVLSVYTCTQPSKTEFTAGTCGTA